MVFDNFNLNDLDKFNSESLEDLLKDEMEDIKKDNNNDKPNNKMETVGEKFDERPKVNTNKNNDDVKSEKEPVSKKLEIIEDKVFENKFLKSLMKGDINIKLLNEAVEYYRNKHPYMSLKIYYESYHSSIHGERHEFYEIVDFINKYFKDFKSFDEAVICLACMLMSQKLHHIVLRPIFLFKNLSNNPDVESLVAILHSIEITEDEVKSIINKIKKGYVNLNNFKKLLLYHYQNQSNIYNFPYLSIMVNYGCNDEDCDIHKEVESEELYHDLRNRMIEYAKEVNDVDEVLLSYVYRFLSEYIDYNYHVMVVMMLVNSDDQFIINDYLYGSDE